MPFARQTGPVLELWAGVPGWYPPATAAVFLTVISALMITPLRWPYTVAVLGAATAALWRVWLQEKGRARHARIRIYPGQSVALVDRDGNEAAADIAGRAWVSPWLIVLPLKDPSGAKLRIVIPRDRNDPDAFRRLTVLCRFGFAVDESDRHNEYRSNTTGA